MQIEITTERLSALLCIEIRLVITISREFFAADFIRALFSIVDVNE